MFLLKNVAALYITILLTNFCSCNNKITNIPFFADSVKINNWKKTYDSLYDTYYSKKEIKYLKQGGHFADSILLFEQQLLKDTSQQKIFFFTLFNRALDLNDLHLYVKSRELLDRYITLYHQYQLSKPNNLAYAQKTLGNIYSRYGDYKKAALLLQQSLEYNIRVKDTLEISSCILNIAIPLKELRRYDEAEQTFQKILQLPSVDPKRKAKACIELADIYTRQYKMTGAGLQLLKAKEFLTSVPQTPDRTETVILLLNIEGDWQMANNNPLEALIAYERSLDSASIISGGNLRTRDIGKTYIAMGKAMEQLHLYDSALRYYNRALYCVADIDTLDKFSLPSQKDIYAENTIGEALSARADCIIKSGVENEKELENAVSCYKLAFETGRKLLDAFSYDESRFFMLEQTRQQTEKAITVCYRLYQKTKNSRWADEAFSFAEHNKAFVLSESVKRNTAASLFLEDDTLYQKQQLLQRNLSQIEIELGRQNFSGTPDTALVHSLTLARQKTEEDLLATENNIRIKNPQYTNWIRSGESLSPRELINKSVSAGSSFVEYFTGDSAVYAFNGEQNKPVGFYQLSTAVKNNTDSFLHYFADRNLILNNPAGYAATANTLYRSLLAPFITQSNSLLIVPDGFISYIPFDALLTGPANSIDIASFPFLIKQKETYYAFSCKTLLEQSQYKNSSAENPVAAFAPLFANKERGLSPLLHSNEELDAVKQFYPAGEFYSSANATLKQYETTCGHAGIIHLATHAGQGSGMAGIEFYDSTLYLNRIYTMPLKARLVVLSGCETGTGSVSRAEGLMSLARGFSYAGTKNVIGSLWQTEDNTSAEIFKNFYHNLSEDNFSIALHKAKLSVINNASVTSASPYYWSSYIYIGSPSENLRPADGKFFKWIWILAISGILLITIYLLLKKK